MVRMYLEAVKWMRWFARAFRRIVGGLQVLLGWLRGI